MSRPKINAADARCLTFLAEAVRVNVRQAKGELRIHNENPLDVLLRLADSIDQTARSLRGEPAGEV